MRSFLLLLLLVCNFVMLLAGCAPPTFGVARTDWNDMPPEIQQIFMVSYYRYQNLGDCSCKCAAKNACVKRYALFNKEVLRCADCGDRNCPELALRKPQHRYSFYENYKPLPAYYQTTTSKAGPAKQRSVEEELSQEDLQKIQAQESADIKPADIEKSLEETDATTGAEEAQVPTPTTGAPGIPTKTPTTGVPEDVPVPSKKEVTEGVVESGALDTTTKPNTSTTNGSTTTNGATTNGSTTTDPTPSTPTTNSGTSQPTTNNTQTSN